jgi:hypothetical protein
MSYSFGDICRSASGLFCRPSRKLLALLKLDTVKDARSVDAQQKVVAPSMRSRRNGYAPDNLIEPTAHLLAHLVWLDGAKERNVSRVDTSVIVRASWASLLRSSVRGCRTERREAQTGQCHSITAAPQG